MDTFPALVIYTGLLALSRRPDAWRNNEGILFTREDLLRPGATPTWRMLAEIGDPEIEHAARRLQSACRPEWRFDGDLERLLRDPISAPRFTGVSATPNLDWHRRTSPGTHPPDAAGAQPTDAAAAMTFGGVSGKTPSFAPDPPTQRTAQPTPTPTPTTADKKSITPATVLAAAAIALTLALVLGVVAGSDGEYGPLVGVITAIVVFAGALRLLRRRL